MHATPSASIQKSAFLNVKERAVLEALERAT
jgi:hypothetical protein